MDYITGLLFNAAPYVHYIALFLLFLAAFNLPISEDLVIIVSASIAATIVPENTWKIYAGCWAGAYISDVIAYFIGKYFIGEYLLKHPVISKKKIISRGLSEERIEKLKKYFSRYGLKTLFFGRFIPMRNILFMTCGLIKMPAVHFMIVDALALTCTSSILFSISYSLGENYMEILPWVDRYKTVLLILIALAAVFINRKKIKAFFTEEKKAGADTVPETEEEKQLP